METITITKFKEQLQLAAKSHGEQGVLIAKSLMLNGVSLVDDTGNPVDPESVEISISGGAAAPMGASTAPDEVKQVDTTELAKSIRETIRKEMNSIVVPKGIVQSDVVSRKMFKKVKNFKSAEEAYRFGQFMLAAAGRPRAKAFCAAHGIISKAHSEGVNTDGGFLVPEQFEEAIITLREQYGVFRRNAGIKPMTRDTLIVPRRKNGLTSYWVGETTAGTESTQSFENITLVAKKLMVLTTISSELEEDAIVNMGDDIANEIAYEFAKKEDDAGFNGDGTSTYGGIVGLANAVGSAGVVDSGINTGALSGSSTATIAPMFAKAPAWSISPKSKIYCHKSVYHELFEAVAMKSGGVTSVEVANGMNPRFFGYAVEFVQNMPASSTTVDGTVLAYFGDLSVGAYFGDRREMSVKTSDSALNAFEQDEIAIKGTQRIDINCCNVGDSTNAGAIIKFTR